MRGKVLHVAEHHLDFLQRYAAEAGGMKFFEARRVRLRHECAHLYPDVARDVWLSARKVARLLRSQGPRSPCLQYGCARGRVLCKRHFEFRGGMSGRQYLTGLWESRMSPVGGSRVAMQDQE